MFLMYSMQRCCLIILLIAMLPFYGLFVCLSVTFVHCAQMA